MLLLPLMLWAARGSAANAIVKDGNTIQLGDITYRLDGVDAPELDQVCIDDHADTWTCGIDARDQLGKADRRPRGAMRRCRPGYEPTANDTAASAPSRARR